MYDIPFKLQVCKAKSEHPEKSFKQIGAEYGVGASAVSNWYKEYMCRVKTHGMETFLLEYTGDQKVVTKIKKFVKDYGMTGYYASSDVNL